MRHLPSFGLLLGATCAGLTATSPALSRLLLLVSANCTFFGAASATLSGLLLLLGANCTLLSTASASLPSLCLLRVSTARTGRFATSPAVAASEGQTGTRHQCGKAQTGQSLFDFRDVHGVSP